MVWDSEVSWMRVVMGKLRGGGKAGAEGTESEQQN